MLICKHCGREFPRGRKIALYCSQKCRVYARRAAEVTPITGEEEVCSHCGAPKGAIFTEKEYRDELNSALKIQLEQFDRDKVKPLKAAPFVEPEISYD